MKICLIHGHGATSDSFNFLRSELGSADFIALEYDSAHGFAANLKTMALQLAREPRVFFIAHSLGGLYALHLAGLMGDRAVGAVTMSTPFGGSEVALALNMFRPQQIFLDIHTVSGPVMQGHCIDLKSPHWTSIITTKGHSAFMAAANDGVCTQDSMRNRRGVKFIDVDSSHHEILQSRRAADIIRAALLEVAA